MRPVLLLPRQRQLQKIFRVSGGVLFSAFARNYMRSYRATRETKRKLKIKIRVNGKRWFMARERPLRITSGWGYQGRPQLPLSFAALAVYKGANCNRWELNRQRIKRVLMRKWRKWAWKDKKKTEKNTKIVKFLKFLKIILNAATNIT